MKTKLVKLFNCKEKEQSNVLALGVKPLLFGDLLKTTQRLSSCQGNTSTGDAKIPTKENLQYFKMMLSRYASQEQRVGLMQELDHYHDAMKTLLNFHLEPGVDPRFG